MPFKKTIHDFYISQLQWFEQMIEQIKTPHIPSGLPS